MEVRQRGSGIQREDCQWGEVRVEGWGSWPAGCGAPSGPGIEEAWRGLVSGWGVGCDCCGGLIAGVGAEGVGTGAGA